MDTYGHLFPSRNRGWVYQLDEAEIVPASYPRARRTPRGAVEQGSDKPLDLQRSNWWR